MRIVLAQILAQTGHCCMGFGPAQVFLGAVLTNGCFHQRRPGEKYGRALAHQNHVIRQAGQVGSAGRGGTMHHGYLWQTRRRHPRLIGETAPAFHKYFALVHQVGTTAFHQIDQWQFVLARNLLCTQRLAQTHRRDGAAFHPTVVGRNQASLPGHNTDAND